jgi:plastocyanin
VTPTVEDPSITPTITITPTVTPTITIGLAEVLPTPTPTIESTPFPTPDYGPTPTPTPTITDDTLSSALSTPTPTIESTPFPTLFPTPTPAVTSVSFACRLDVVGSVEEDPTLCQLNVVASYIQPTPTPTIDLANCILELTASSEELDCSLTINSSYEALPVTYNFNVINNGTSNWEIENEGFDPELVVKVGDTLNFTNYSSSVHPFYIKTAQTTGTTNLVSGVSGQGSHSGGTTSWTPLTTGTYYYQCSNHINMSGVITVTN